MKNRHSKVGIKQGLRIEWLDRALKMKMAGLSNKEMRDDLTKYLSFRLDNGEFGERGKSTTKIAISMIMNIWGDVDAELMKFQSTVIDFARKDNNFLVSHWAMLCAAYPFWYRVAQHTGRLLFLQKQTNKNQIIQRIKESYGERSSVIRSAQRVVQGFLNFQVLKEVDNANKFRIDSTINLTIENYVLLIESALYAEPDGKLSLDLIKNNPAFFPFQIPQISSESINQLNKRIGISNHFFGEELVVLRK